MSERSDKYMAEMEQRGEIAGIATNEITTSMTGFEGIAVKAKFGNKVSALDSDETMIACAFVVLRRERHGETSGPSSVDQAVYEEVMGLSLNAVIEILRPYAPIEAMPEEPVTDAGKELSLTS